MALFDNAATTMPLQDGIDPSCPAWCDARDHWEGSLQWQI
jgi:hypothetical protein